MAHSPGHIGTGARVYGTKRGRHGSGLAENPTDCATDAADKVQAAFYGVNGSLNALKNWGHEIPRGLECGLNDVKRGGERGPQEANNGLNSLKRQFPWGEVNTNAGLNPLKNGLKDGPKSVLEIVHYGSHRGLDCSPCNRETLLEPIGLGPNDYDSRDQRRDCEDDKTNGVGVECRVK